MVLGWNFTSRCQEETGQRLSKRVLRPEQSRYEWQIPTRCYTQEVEMPRPRAESDVSKQLPAGPSLAPGEKTAGEEPKLDRSLHHLAANALQETGASSVAIGLEREGTMICRAVAGLPLADLGAPINTESGLTGIAIRRQMSQWCSDTESDLRVDVEVCRQLGVRSIIVVPVCARDIVVGLFAIFSVSPDAFSLGDLNTVKQLAHWAAEAVETTARNAAPQTIPPAIAAQDQLSEKQPVGVNPERTHSIRTYAARIRHAIALALFRGRSGNPG
jgi:transcriptional regulator with GAF, ATPase, and Fis domain